MRETFYKLRMGLCSMRTGITNFLSVFSCWKNDFTPLLSDGFFSSLFSSLVKKTMKKWFSVIVFFTSEENSEEKSRR